MQTPKRWVARALATLAVLIVAAGATATASATVSGQVTCASGENVEGVWIASAVGGSGWANWWSITGYTAGYSYGLGNTRQWTVHVGCGGSPQHWANALNGASWASGSYASWTCYDWWMAYPYHGWCQRT